MTNPEWEKLLSPVTWFKLAFYVNSAPSFVSFHYHIDHPFLVPSAMYVLSLNFTLTTSKPHQVMTLNRDAPIRSSSHCHVKVIAV